MPVKNTEDTSCQGTCLTSCPDLSPYCKFIPTLVPPAPCLIGTFISTRTSQNSRLPQLMPKSPLLNNWHGSYLQPQSARPLSLVIPWPIIISILGPTLKEILDISTPHQVHTRILAQVSSLACPDSWNSLLTCFLFPLLCLHIPGDLEQPVRFFQSIDQITSIPCLKPRRLLIMLWTKRLPPLCTHILSWRPASLCSSCTSVPFAPWAHQVHLYHSKFISAWEVCLPELFMACSSTPPHSSPTSKDSFLGFPILVILR